jgi:hypothetical protein
MMKTQGRLDQRCLADDLDVDADRGQRRVARDRGDEVDGAACPRRLGVAEAGEEGRAIAP